MVRVVIKDSGSRVPDFQQPSSTMLKPYRCSDCHKTFTRPDALKRHASIHNADLRFECELCDQTFAQRGSVRRHMLTHTKKKPYKCEKCPAFFTQSGSLNKHVLSKHSVTQRDFKCDICGIRFNRADALKRHSRRHDQARYYQCGKCPEKFQRLESLKAHNVKIHGRLKEIDSRTSDIESGKKTYEFIHGKPRLSSSMKRTDYAYVKCENCPKVCANISSLRKHMEIHTRKQKHKCNFCTASFRLASILSRHIQLHEGVKEGASEHSGCETSSWVPIYPLPRSSKRVTRKKSSSGDNPEIEIFMKREPGTGVDDIPAEFDLIIKTDGTVDNESTTPISCPKEAVIELVDVIKQEPS